MAKTNGRRTIRERLIAGLREKGLTEVQSRGSSVVFEVPDRPGVFYYVGKIDSLRIGRNKATSIPANRLKAELLKEHPEEVFGDQIVEWWK